MNTRFSTGFKALDAITNGYEESEFIIIGARPAMGKSGFMVVLPFR